MTPFDDLRLERVFPAEAQTVFRLVTSPDGLLQWWGPEGMSVLDHALDFTREGPWYSVIANADGQRFKVSGQVTRVDPPRSVAFTWGWHDAEDRRGAESHVTFTLTPTEAGTRFVIDHVGLPDADAVHNHTKGWTSLLVKLQRCAV